MSTPKMKRPADNEWKETWPDSAIKCLFCHTQMRILRPDIQGSPVWCPNCGTAYDGQGASSQYGIPLANEGKELA